MNAVIVTAPTIEPVTVWEVKKHLRIDGNTEDDLIQDLVKSCREQVEQITNRALLTQTWDYYLEDFPGVDYITLPFGNLQSVTSVKWKDVDGTETTMTVTTEYLVETNGPMFGKIFLPDGETWPSESLYPSRPITIRFVAGWTTAALVPMRIKHAIKMLCAAQYEERGEALVGSSFAENKTAAMLLQNERLWGAF